MIWPLKRTLLGGFSIITFDYQRVNGHVSQLCGLRENPWWTICCTGAKCDPNRMAVALGAYGSDESLHQKRLKLGHHGIPWLWRELVSRRPFFFSMGSCSLILYGAVNISSCVEVQMSMMSKGSRSWCFRNTASVSGRKTRNSNNNSWSTQRASGGMAWDGWTISCGEFSGSKVNRPPKFPSNAFDDLFIWNGDHYSPTISLYHLINIWDHHHIKPYHHLIIKPTNHIIIIDD